MNIREKLAGDYLRVSDYPDAPETVTIIRVIEETPPFAEEDEVFYYLAVKERSEKIPLNRTNALRLCAAFGDETDAWKGRKVTLSRFAQPGNETFPFVAVIQPLTKKTPPKPAPKGRGKGSSAPF